MSTAPTGNPRSNYLQGDDGNWYNANGERVYYWVPPAETDSTIGGGSETQGIGQDLGGYYTESEIKAAWDADDGMGNLKAQTDWGSYWGFISERQGEIQSGNLIDPIQGDYAGQAKADGLANTDADYQANSGRDEEVYYAQVDSNTQLSQQDQMAGWLDQNADLMSKYGIESEITNDDGDTFKFNGSTYSRTYKAPGVDYGELGAGLMLGAFGASALAPAIASGLGGIGGSALPAGVAGPPAPLLSPGVAKGIAAGATNAAQQGILTGSIDPKEVLAAGVVGGLAPGEVLADKVGDTLGLSAPGNPFNPDSFGYGAISGAGNSAVGQLITEGSVDLKDVAQAGLLTGAINSVRDAFDDSNYYTQEEIAQRYLAQGYTADEAWRLAGESPLLNSSDLGALVGEGGLLPFIPRAPIGFIDGAKTLLTGAGAYAELPDGTKIPHSVYSNQAPYQFTGEDGNVYVGNGSDRMMELDATFNEAGTPGLFNNPVVNTVFNPIANLLTSGEAELSDQQQAVYDASKEQAENLYSDMDDGVAKTAAINNATQAAFNNYYAHFHGDDGLDENYTVSPNPRGDSQIIGATFQGYDDKGEPIYTTGTTSYEQLANGSWIPSTLSAITEAAGGSSVSGSSATTNTNQYNPATYEEEYQPDPDLVFYVNGEGGVLPDGDTSQDFENWLLVNSILGGSVVLPSDVVLPSSENQSATSVEAESTDGVASGGSQSAESTQATTSTDAVAVSDVSGGTDAVVPSDIDSALPGSVELPTGGGGGGDDGGGIGLFSAVSGLPLLWDGLFPYRKFKGYSKKRQKIYDDMLKGLGASGLFAQASGMSPMERELYEAGELIR